VTGFVPVIRSVPVRETVPVTKSVPVSQTELQAVPAIRFVLAILSIEYTEAAYEKNKKL
jgi:hypothetical protein